MMTPEQRVKILREAKPDSWLAFSADESRLVATADSYADVVRKASENGEENPLITKTPDSWIPLVSSPVL
jgi:hypothetical protein